MIGRVGNRVLVWVIGSSSFMRSGMSASVINRSKCSPKGAELIARLARTVCYFDLKCHCTKRLCGHARHLEIVLDRQSRSSALNASPMLSGSLPTSIGNVDGFTPPPTQSCPCDGLQPPGSVPNI